MSDGKVYEMNSCGETKSGNLASNDLASNKYTNSRKREGLYLKNERSNQRSHQKDQGKIVNKGDDNQKEKAPLAVWQNGSLTAINGREESTVEKSCHQEEDKDDYEKESSLRVKINPAYKDTDAFTTTSTSTSTSISSSSSSSSSSSTDEETLSLPEESSAAEVPTKNKVPDGGWGWVVVVASLVISMIADGVSFSFGLLYIEFLKEFGASKAKTAWIGSLFMAVPLLSGPVMSALVDRYGCRNMTIAGGLISGLGFVLSSFSDTIEVMYLTFGVLAGLGLGLCYVTAVVSIAFWFDKKRTLAVGLGACGTGIGTFVYAPMTTYFIREYGWRGTCLLLAGTFFNMIVCGSVMRDPVWWLLEQKKQARRDLEGLKGTPRKVLGDASSSIGGGSGFRSVLNLPTFVKENEKVPVEVLESLSSDPRLYTAIVESYNIPREQRQRSPSVDEGNKNGVVNSARCNSRADSTSTKVLVARRMSRKDTEEVSPLLYKEARDREQRQGSKSLSKHHLPSTAGVVRTDSLPWLRRQFNTSTHYFKDIRVHRNSVMYRGAALNLNKYRLRASSCPNIYTNSITTLAQENADKCCGELAELLRGIIDFSMFLELHFLLMSLATILLFTWFIVPYFYLAEHLTRNGYSEGDGANLLSVIGITNTIGMIGLGWAGDQPWMNVNKTYAWCLIMCGITTILMSVFTHHYTLLVISSAAFGLSFASNFSFTPVILVELISLERFTTAYGLTLLCQGIGNLLGPPLAGWLFDVTSSWELSFLMAGGWIIFSGLLIGLIPYTNNRRIWLSSSVKKEKSVDCLA